MKYLSVLLIAICIAVSSCHKGGTAARTTTTYMDSAVIKGPSPFMTACGGAYWIVIDTVGARTTFNSLPSGSGIDLSTATFPISVKINWHYQLPNTCAIVVIDGIERID